MTAPASASDDPFIAVMISCAERAAIRARTLASLAASDWGAEPIVVLDPATEGRRQERQHRNAREALRRGLATGRRWILFLEDDLDFNRQIRRNLLCWEPLAYLTLASLYNPKIHGRRPRGGHFVEVDPGAIYGSQAYLLSRDCAAHVVEHWDEVEGMQDIKMSRLAGALGMPIYYYAPSLVQHIGVRSTFGGFFHQAGDYDPAFVFPDDGGAGIEGETMTTISGIYDHAFWEMHAPWRGEYDAMGDALVRVLDFSSALDVGCGNGFLIARLQSRGKTVAGIDGSAVARDFAPAEVRDRIALADLSAPIRARAADLVICTEVAEHLDPAFAEVLATSIAGNARSWIFFSAATPGQGGLHHVNEQPHDYWLAKFAARGFALDGDRTARLRGELEPAMRTTWWFPRNALVLGRRSTPG